MASSEKPLLEIPQSLRAKYATFLRECRLQQGLTQKAVGEAVGVHRVYVVNMEQGAVNFSVDTLEKFLRFLAPDQDDRTLRVRMADNLRSWREGKYSQEEVAVLAEVPVLYISRIERGVVATSIDQIEHLANKLGIDLLN
jgi:transcriptional regulator with XRE-family HTH domain